MFYRSNLFRWALDFFCAHQMGPLLFLRAFFMRDDFRLRPLGSTDYYVIFGFPINSLITDRTEFDFRHSFLQMS